MLYNLFSKKKKEKKVEEWRIKGIDGNGDGRFYLIFLTPTREQNVVGFKKRRNKCCWKAANV